MQGGQADSADLLALTIVGHNYLTRAQIVADSFLAHLPGADFYIVATDYALDTDISAYSGKNGPAYQWTLDNLAGGKRAALIAYHLAV